MLPVDPLAPCIVSPSASVSPVEPSPFRSAVSIQKVFYTHYGSISDPRLRARNGGLLIRCSTDKQVSTARTCSRRGHLSYVPGFRNIQRWNKSGNSRRTSFAWTLLASVASWLAKKEEGWHALRCGFDVCSVFDVQSIVVKIIGCSVLVFRTDAGQPGHLDQYHSGVGCVEFLLHSCR